MSISKGGRGFGFCPGKATWSYEAAELLSMVEITYHTRSLFYPGSISEQPSWYIELIKDMLPFYEAHRTAQKQNAMWGGDSKNGKIGKSKHGQTVGKKTGRTSATWRGSR